MNLTRPIVFWIAMLAAVIAVIVLLREVLLPFVAALVLAYLLDPLASRIERLGMNRLLATLTIVISAIITVVLLSMLTLPVIVRELEYFIESFPLYIHRLHTLADDANRPWPSKLVGQGLGEAERSIGDLTASASNWAGTFLRSIWSGGRALISMLSLAVVTPIVASYLPLELNDCGHRQLDTARAARDRARACPRYRRHDRRFCSWPEHTLSRARSVLWSDIVVDRT